MHLFCGDRGCSGAVTLLEVEPGQLAGADEDSGEHDAVEAAGIGVAQRGMVAGEEMDAVGQPVLCAVGEAIGGAGPNDIGVKEMGEEAVEGDLAEADDDADSWECGELMHEVLAAVADLLRERLVAGRSAADDGGDPGVAELEAVVAVDGLGLVGEAELVEDGVHEVAGAVSGEGATGTVGSVGTGSEAQQEHAGVRIAEAGDGA